MGFLTSNPNRFEYANADLNRNTVAMTRIVRRRFKRRTQLKSCSNQTRTKTNNQNRIQTKPESNHSQLQIKPQPELQSCSNQTRTKTKGHLALLFVKQHAPHPRMPPVCAPVHRREPAPVRGRDVTTRGGSRARRHTTQLHPKPKPWVEEARGSDTLTRNPTPSPPT